MTKPSRLNPEQNFERIALENIESYFLGNGKPLTPVNDVKEAPRATTNISN